MFDDNRYNETDDLLRSILSQGEEDVPAHVWEGVSSQLDRISTRKTVMLWFRRTAVAAAAAAVVAVGVFTDWTGNGDIVPQAAGTGLIAVADTPLIHPGHDLDGSTVCLPRL
jgi:anti-sigma factor RsiW